MYGFLKDQAHKCGIVSGTYRVRATHCLGISILSHVITRHGSMGEQSDRFLQPQAVFYPNVKEEITCQSLHMVI